VTGLLAALSVPEARRFRTMWFPWACYARRLDLPAEPDVRTA